MRKFVLLLIFSAFILTGIFISQYLKFYDGKLRVVFCNVGQGDGIFIRTSEGLDIVVDGGPNDSMLSCLSSNMPFWDKEIELVILTHPHADHLIGLNSIFKYYKVTNFATERLANKTAAYKEFLQNLKMEKSYVKYLYEGDNIKLGQSSIKILAPSKSFLQDSSPQGLIGESKEFASLIGLFSFKEFDLLLTGDSQKEVLLQLTNTIYLNKISLEVLQVPHHGSKTGLNNELVEFLKPKIAAISVGKNKYGHPSKEILNILKKNKIKILRTDKNGEVEITTDGKSFSIN